MKNKKERTKNRTLKSTKWERRKSRKKVVYRNYGSLVGEVEINSFKTRTKISTKKFHVAELVKSGRQYQKKKNPSKVRRR